MTYRHTEVHTEGFTPGGFTCGVLWGDEGGAEVYLVHHGAWGQRGRGGTG